jgi:hypothetical protein
VSPEFMRVEGRESFELGRSAKSSECITLPIRAALQQVIRPPLCMIIHRIYIIAREKRTMIHRAREWMVHLIAVAPIRGRVSARLDSGLLRRRDEF